MGRLNHRVNIAGICWVVVSLCVQLTHVTHAIPADQTMSAGNRRRPTGPAPDNSLGHGGNGDTSFMNMKGLPAGAVDPSCVGCRYMIDNMVKGRWELLQSICNELAAMAGANSQYYKYCVMTMDQLQNKYEDKVKYWLFHGCYDQIHTRWLRPCPSYAICQGIMDFKSGPFCYPVKKT